MKKKPMGTIGALELLKAKKLNLLLFVMRPSSSC